jgi:glucose-6-phosphate 1-dehydrogenase
MDATLPGGGPSQHRRLAEPCAFVIFGAGGDLTKRLLVPALYNLAAARLLPERFAVIGAARHDLSNGEFRRRMGEALQQFATVRLDPPTVEKFLATFSYVNGDFDDPTAYPRLEKALAEIDRTCGAGRNVVFYLATPPSVFATIARNLGKAGLARNEEGSFRRLVVEKPFGTDLKSAQELNRDLLSIFAENQIFRIDHYLGKETVQNIMVLRFANGLFEPIWSRDQIDHVQITVAETLGVEQRGRSYDAIGALRDMVPNHLFQLLALTAMEPPICFDADAVRTEKTKAIAAIHTPRADDCLTDVVRGQYRAGRIDGKDIAGYRDSPGVSPSSRTETFVAVRLMIDNWRWAGVPFYLRTGKALAGRRTEIAINFKRAPLTIFRDTPVEHLPRNFLVLGVQPDEGASLQFNAKVPGPAIRIDGVRMDFDYRDHFDAAPTTGYETLLYDCMLGDATLFQRADTIEAGWRVVQPMLDAWAQDQGRSLALYDAGTEGPAEADALLTRDGNKWRSITEPSGRPTARHG